MRTVYLVPHTHWDREWYFGTNQSKVLLHETLGIVLDELENGNLPCFVLDGQTSLVEDYLQFAPDQESRITALVEQGKLQIGPWYTQTDQCVVGAESITRNLLYGIRDSRRYGGHMPVGYLPDSFGQTAQLPQILNGFGLKRCVFWRGLWEGISPVTEFNWQSADGSSVTTAVIQGGYSGAKGMPDDDELSGRRLPHLQGHVDFQSRFNSGDATLLMCGNDQQPWDPRWPELVKVENQNRSDCQYRWSDMPTFFEALESQGDLGQVQGEMMAAKYSRIHRGIWSTRYDIKKANANVENLLTNTLEPILSIGWSLGMSYPHGLLENVWKKLLKSHAHDSIGCCNSDEVNGAVKQRFIDAHQIATQQLELRMRQIAERVITQQAGQCILLFNTLPEARREMVAVEIVVTAENPDEVQLLDSDGGTVAFQVLSSEAVHLSALVQDLSAALAPGESGDPLFYRHKLLVDSPMLPALGYTSLYLQTTGVESSCMVPAGKISMNCIENEQLRVSLQSDGTISLCHLASGQVMTGLLEFVDGGDDGDNYDFSPPREDLLVSTRGQQPEVQTETSELRSVMKLGYLLKAPSDLRKRADRLLDTELPINVSLILDRDQDFVEVLVKVDNGLQDHRLQAVFRTGLATDTSYADQPFGMIQRTANPAELELWRNDSWTSRPLPLYPMQSLVALTDDDLGLAVMTDGIREYELQGDTPGYLAITLFRSVGFMGKGDLVYRPGRLSGMPMATPDSQIQGPLQFRFALSLFKGHPSSMAKATKRFLSPVSNYQASRFNKFSINRGVVDLPDHYSLAQWHTPLVVSAIKKAENRDALLIRAFNPADIKVDTAPLEVVAGHLGSANVEQVNLNEDPLGENQASEPMQLLAPQQVYSLLLSGFNRSD